MHIRFLKRLSFIEGLEPRQPLASHAIGTSGPTLVSQVVDSSMLAISDFMSVNGDSLQTKVRTRADVDFDGGLITPDWIELSNSTPQAIDLGGMFLTDNRNDFQKCQFPLGTTIPPIGQLLLFASGMDIGDPRLDEMGIIHTNVRLSGGGEYVGLVCADGTIVSEFNATVPEQFEDVSCEATELSDDVGYFTNPTPGEPNGAVELIFDGPFVEVTHECL